MKYLKYIVAAFALVIALGALWIQPKKATEADFLLDTYISVTAYGSGARQAAEKAIARVRELDRLLSAFYPDSDVSKINSAGADVPVAVSDECFGLIERAMELSEKTGGAFDFTIKPVMDLWGFGGENRRVPEDKERKDALELVDWSAVRLDKSTKTVTLLKEGMAIDLGGIAKGYCADAAADVLRQEGIQNAYLDFGGNVVTMGGMPLGLVDRIKYRAGTRPFVVGIQDPGGARGDVLETCTVEQERCAIVTSGGYERYFEENGVRYHHILDPHTGRQPDNGIASVTVIGPSSETADALATALFVTGPEGCGVVSGLFDQVIFVYDTGEVEKIYPQGEN